MKNLKKVLFSIVLLLAFSVSSMGACERGSGESYWSTEGFEPALCHETITVCDAAGGGYDVEITVSCMSFFSDWLFYYL